MNNLKLLRLEQNMTQKELADRLNVTQACVSEIEAGERAPSDKMLEKITKVLKTTTESLNFSLHERLKCITYGFRPDELEKMILFAKFLKYQELLKQT